MEHKNKFKIIPVILVLSLLLIPSVLAINTNVKTLPSSPLAYFFFVSIPEGIEMFFTFNQQEKLMKRTLLSEKRLVEFQKLNQINAPISTQQKAINNYNGELGKVEEMIKRGIISSEEARKIIENNLNRVKKKEKQLPPSDLIQLPIVIGEDSCGGISGQICEEGFKCTCGFSQDCSFDQVGTCTKSRIDDIADRLFCPMIYAPVCGNDGKTYPSECVAIQRGVIVDKKGECEDDEKKQEPISTCKTDRQCQDTKRSCYSKCIDSVCSEIFTFVKLSDYPDCEVSVEPAPIPTPKPVPDPTQPPKEEPIPIPLPPVIETCSSNDECMNRLRSCNAKCIDRECTIVNTFAPTGKYPDCEQRFGVL